ncbi:phospholipase D family protein [Hasllibacter sp. MH4015]|uniref:phospholipase D family protein n=1 Tax=Hasllibacter sp. MH4015 TaxID=2854029 RepID=UPI001CD5BE5D|nr:hypothetical protein [Hasllibacter sp. MH4015]
MSDDIAAAIDDLEILITAQEAYPAFERLWLSAERSIVGCFRVFDLSTRLRSPEARAVGETWFDLLVHKLNEGVEVDITVTDFDPIIATDDHRRSWLSARQLAGAGEIAEGGTLRFSIALHPARVGLLPRLVLRGKVKAELETTDQDDLTPGVAELNPSGDLPLVPATHHQKLCVVDDTALYIGGLDLNERRYDTLSHALPAEETWQDIQAIVRGPVVAAAATHLSTFKGVVEAEADAPPEAAGFLRTLSTKRAVQVVRISPRPAITEIEAAHLDAIRATTGPLYFETQFFRHMPLAEALADAARERPELTCCLILPASPEDVAFEGNEAEDAQFGAQKQMEAIDCIADAFGDRLALLSPARPAPSEFPPGSPATLHGAPIIYVHSKLSLFGGEQAILSSANLNGRSLRWDTEAGVHLTNSEHVRALWDRALGHWLGDLRPDPYSDPLAFAETLNTLAARNLATKPQERQHFLLPYSRARDQELAAPLPGVPPEMV